jgi:predicted patatin/cPLA2 family phospholipase
MKTGCIDVGGGLRDIYGAGVFDYMMDAGIRLDYCIGVSAGSGNCASYIAGQRGRNKHFYLDYITRKEALGIRSYIRNGSFVDLSYVYGSLSNSGGENPLDYQAFEENPTEFKVVATDAETGKPAYFDKQSDMAQNDYTVLMASSCLPVFCKPIEIKGRKYYDGGLSDPLPFRKALDDGCERLVVILTKPIGSELNQNRNALGASVLKRRYPLFSESMKNAADTYAKQLDEVLKLQDSGQALVLAPDDIMELGTLTRDSVKLINLYQKGYNDAKRIKAFLGLDR